MTAAMVNFILTIKTLVLDLEPENKTLETRRRCRPATSKILNWGLAKRRKKDKIKTSRSEWDVEGRK